MSQWTELRCRAPHPEGEKVARFAKSLCDYLLGPVPFRAIATGRILTRFEEVEGFAGRDADRVCYPRRCPKCRMINEFLLVDAKGWATYLLGDQAHDISPVQRRILEVLADRGELNARQLRTAVPTVGSEWRMRQVIHDLQERHLVVRTGATKGSRWAIATEKPLNPQNPTESAAGLEQRA